MITDRKTLTPAPVTDFENAIYAQVEGKFFCEVPLVSYDDATRRNRRYAPFI